MNALFPHLSAIHTAKTFANIATVALPAAVEPLHKAEQNATRIRIELDLLTSHLRFLAEGLADNSAAADLIQSSAAKAHCERQILDAELSRLQSQVQQHDQELQFGVSKVQVTAGKSAETASRAAQIVPYLEALHTRQTTLVDDDAAATDRASACVDRWRALLRGFE